VAERMVQMLLTGRLKSVDGLEVAVSARSICVHGDSPGAVAMAVAVREALAEAGVEIRSFAP
jgi:5-oxoprolinase (ATP-hydrolysing) subunit A